MLISYIALLIVPLSFTPLESSESDLIYQRNLEHISMKRYYTKGLYVESHTHEILSLSSILVLIPNSYSTKMVEVFGLDLLELTHQNIHRNYPYVTKICLDESRINGVKLLCTKFVEKSELMDNFGFLIQNLIRTLPTMSKEFATYLNTFRPGTTAELRKLGFRQEAMDQNFDRQKDFDRD